jgi:hypothetical protein
MAVDMTADVASTVDVDNDTSAVVADVAHLTDGPILELDH